VGGRDVPDEVVEPLDDATSEIAVKLATVEPTTLTGVAALLDYLAVKTATTWARVKCKLQTTARSIMLPSGTSTRLDAWVEGGAHWANDASIVC